MSKKDPNKPDEELNTDDFSADASEIEIVGEERLNEKRDKKKGVCTL